MSTVMSIMHSLIGLFVDDEMLAGAILAIVAATAVLILGLGLEPLLGGVLLLLGNVAILVAGTVRTAHRKDRK